MKKKVIYFVFLFVSIVPYFCFSMHLVRRAGYKAVGIRNGNKFQKKKYQAAFASVVAPEYKQLDDEETAKDNRGPFFVLVERLVEGCYERTSDGSVTYKDTDTVIKEISAYYNSLDVFNQTGISSVFYSGRTRISYGTIPLSAREVVKRVIGIAIRRLKRKRC